MSHGSILFPHKQFLVGQGHVCQLKMHNVVRHRMRNLSICVKQRILYRYDLLSKILYYHTLGLKINGANEFVLYFPEKKVKKLVGRLFMGRFLTSSNDIEIYISLQSIIRCIFCVVYLFCFGYYFIGALKS